MWSIVSYVVPIFEYSASIFGICGKIQYLRKTIHINQQVSGLQFVQFTKGILEFAEIVSVYPAKGPSQQ
jgi:hypothetical protein